MSGAPRTARGEKTRRRLLEAAEHVHHRAPQRVALCLEPRIALAGEALDGREHGVRIEMRFGDDVGFEAARQPMIVPVGRQ